MAGYRYLIFLVPLILLSCAQVGSLTGGEKDITPPRPISDKITPPNESINFTAKEVKIPFQEFFRLSNPAQNIKIVPPHAKINTTVKGKTLLLNWEEDLNPNTTYVIYLNNAVKDVTENNDTIIQYVFSTGSVIDTIGYETTIVDAWTSLPVKECLVGLYDSETEELVSFAETDENGEAKLNYLHKGDYSIRAFIDQNGDIEIQSHESVGYPVFNHLQLDSTVSDSIPIRLFTPLPPAKIRTKSFMAPGAFIVGATRNITNEKIFLNGQQLTEEHYSFLDKDSIVLYSDVTALNSAEIVVQSDLINDTVSLRFTDKMKARPVTLRGINASNHYASSESVAFLTNDFITGVDTSRIEIQNAKDSSIINDYTFKTLQNKLIFEFNKEGLHDLSIVFKDKALTTLNGFTGLNKFAIILDTDRSYGTLKIDLSYYTGSIILHVLKDDDPYKIIEIQNPHEVYRLTELQPANYTFKVVHDENENGDWDIGVLEELLQPERVDNYSVPNKVRANWEMELSLIPAR